MERTGLVFNIQRYSLHDGPGIRTTVFFKGCPLACRWCHNIESQGRRPEAMIKTGRCVGCGACVQICPSGAVALVDGLAVTDRAVCTACGACIDPCPENAREICGDDLTVDQVMDEIRPDRVFYEQSGGGVTISGGEPLDQIDFLADLLAACKAEDLQTCVDTSGHAPWSAFERILATTDLFLYDLKLMDDARHREQTGVTNRRVIENLRRLREATDRIMICVPVIPGINDDDANIDAAIALIGDLALDEIELLPYHALGRGKAAQLGRVWPLEGIETPSAARMKDLQSRFAAAGLPAVIGGSA